MRELFLPATVPHAETVIWPDCDQTLLLHAALDDPQRAHFAFAQWCRVRRNAGSCVDFPSQRLLPMVYANLARGTRDFPHSRYLRGLYRIAWRDSEALRRGAPQAARVLREAGIDVMVSKGCVTAADYYTSRAERPSADCDLYLRPAALPRAIDLLIDAGWQPARVYRDLPIEELARFGLGLCLQHATHGEIDLHCRLIKDSADSRVEQVIWASAEIFRLGDIEVLRPSPAHLLLHVIAHGVRPDIFATLRWITDAVLILRKHGDTLDWDSFWLLAARARLTARVSAGLRYLGDHFALNLPMAGPMRASGLIERLERRAFARPLTGLPSSRFYRTAAFLRRIDQRSWSDRCRWLVKHTRRVLSA